MASVFKRGGRGPWIVMYFDAENRRREKSTRTTDKRAADRIAADIDAKVALRREGLIDARQDRLAEHARRPLAEHVADYLAHCRTAEQADRHVAQKQSHLAAFQQSAGLTRLAELDAAALEADLRRLRDSGLSARTVNFRRQIVVAFANWLVRSVRLASNPLKAVPKLDEQRDRRRVRRALSDDELARLVAEARPRGRALWYLTAALAGLRKGELRALRWADVDLEAGVLTIRNSKAGRTDDVPLHPQLADELRASRPAMALPTAAVFPQTVTDRTRQLDFQRAGIAAVDDAGRVADLHACRTALGTRLARLGVAPQVAQRVMRHADYRTTLRHYTVLGLADTARAVSELPDIGTPGDAAQLATGTDGAPVGDPQHQPQQSQDETARRRAIRCVEAVAGDDDDSGSEGALEPAFAGECDAVRDGALERVTGFEPATFSLGS